MSYSRWSCSDWYAFHTTESGETKETQKLALWYAGADENPIYTYEELKTIWRLAKVIWKKLLIL
jgi:hypothetical protein